jgi:hypothetical protein
MSGDLNDNPFEINRLGRGVFPRAIGGILFVVGWLLSPLTWWNDALINIPLAWLLASWIAQVHTNAFAFFFLLFFWLTNLAGFILMYFGWRFFRLKKPVSKREMLVSFFVSLGYTAVILILIKLGVLKPL